MKTIPLTKGYFTKVDNDDYKKFAIIRWQVAFSNDDIKHPRVKRTDYSNGIQKNIYLHREIIGAKEGEYVDHINGDGLDNRKCNLRICTLSQNSQNKNQSLNNTSGYKGVTWDKNKGKWKSQIAANNKKICIGHFKNKIDAAKAYDEKAKELHGDFAKTNEMLLKY